MDSTWQHDWKTFVEMIAEKLRQHATSEELARLFRSKPVTWSGVLTEKLIDDLAPLVTIVMPVAQIDLGDSGVVDLSNQSVPVARNAIADWDAIPIGTAVTFTATLGAGMSPFVPVQVVRLTSGRTVVMIRLSDGRPCQNHDQLRTS